MSQALLELLARRELQSWQQVPQLVVSRYKFAASMQSRLQKVLTNFPLPDPDYGRVYVHPETEDVWAVLGKEATEQDQQRWHNMLKSLGVAGCIRTHKTDGPQRVGDWIRVKQAAALSWLNAPYALAGRLTGGPGPLSNSIVSGLLGAGAGYVGGAVAEHLLPEEYVNRGKLRKNLALLGGAAGVGLHVPQAVANMQLNQEATGSPQVLKSLMGDQHQQLSPHEFTLANNRAKAAAAYVKQTYGDTGAMDDLLKPVPVDAFNQAIWNDVHNGARSSQSNMYGTRSVYGGNADQLHTPPQHAAAVSGLVTGVQQLYGSPPALTPLHFIRGLATAGVDVATANIAGKALGALGGLTPQAQRKLQDIGIWSGMIRGIAGSVFGM